MTEFKEYPVTRSHYVKKALIISLVYGMFKVQNDLIKTGESPEGLACLPINLAPEYEKMVEDRLEELQDELFSWITGHKEHRMIYEKVDNLKATKLPEALHYIADKEVDLRILGCYVMYVTFIEPNYKVLHKNFEPWTDITRFNLIVDTLTAGGVSLMYRLNMYRLAKELTLRL